MVGGHENGERRLYGARERLSISHFGEGERIGRRFGVLFTALLVLRTERPLQFSPLPAHSEVVTLWELALISRSLLPWNR